MQSIKGLANKEYLITFSAFSILSFIARALLDWRYVFPFMLNISDSDAVIGTIIYAILVLIPIVALLNIKVDLRWPIFVLLIFHALQFLFLGIMSSLYLCPSPCPTIWPIGEIIIWSSTLTGLLALLSTVLYWRKNVSK
jgi:hypothetical protein